MTHATIDKDFTARTLLAMRDDVQKQNASAERIRVMFNVLASKHRIEPVDLATEVYVELSRRFDKCKAEVSAQMDARKARRLSA